METSQTSSQGTGAKVDLQRGSKHSGDMHYKAEGEAVDAEGLDATLKKKLDAKYDHALEAEVRAWMGGLLGSPVEGDFMTVLKDGHVLCKLVNIIRPGIVKKINKMKMAFMQMENIGSFLGERGLNQLFLVDCCCNLPRFRQWITCRHCFHPDSMSCPRSGGIRSGCGCFRILHDSGLV